MPVAILSKLDDDDDNDDDDEEEDEDDDDDDDDDDDEEEEEEEEDVLSAAAPALMNSSTSPPSTVHSFTLTRLLLERGALRCAASSLAPLLSLLAPDAAAPGLILPSTLTTRGSSSCCALPVSSSTCVWVSGEEAGESTRSPLVPPAGSTP